MNLEVNELRKESVPLRSTKIIERVCTSLRASLASKRQSSSLVVLFGSCVATRTPSEIRWPIYREPSMVLKNVASRTVELDYE